MQKIITYNFTEDLISNIADHLENNFLKKGGDLSRAAIIFGGKRPSLFLKRELAKRVKQSFFSPHFFSIDQFMKFIVSRRGDFRAPSDLETSYIIYTCAKELSSGILSGREKFSDFLPWAKEITGFIDELDIENISMEKLQPVESLSGIGYEIPGNINNLLQNIIELRGLYHTKLRSRNLLSRGILYMDAARLIKETKFPEFDKILFCNFYYLHTAEKEILKDLLGRNMASVFFQKDSNSWPVFDNLEKELNISINPLNQAPPSYELKIFKGFDSHSQAGILKEILKTEILEKGEALDKTVIILPDTNNLIPLLSEISPLMENFNVSMGYPLKRSALYSLLKFISNAQLTRKNGLYYTKDYLKVILHPLIKNLTISSDPAATRILAHKVEEILLGIEETSLSGSLFLGLDNIERSAELYELSAAMASNTGIQAFRDILKEINSIFFRMWEDVTNFSQFAGCLEKFCACLLTKSFIHSYPLNIKILDRIYSLIDELKTAEFKDQPFSGEDIFKIFDKKIQAEIVSFSGSPLKGLQILGLFESRSLNFENVLVMDVNESLLPKANMHGSMIPRQIMESLGLQRLKQEEEIQKYHFSRLVSGAKKVYFIYDGSPEKEKSRFLEELIWRKQKEDRTLHVFTETSAKFNPVAAAAQNTVKKSEKIAGYLADNFVYSASSIDTYLNCPLKFYYQYVLRLKEKKNLLDEVEARDIGTFIHELLDFSFRRFLGKKPVIDNVFYKDFFDEFERRFSEKLEKRLGPEAFLVKDVMEYRLKKFIEKERSRNVKKILSLEEKLSGRIELPSGKLIDCRYTIDRVDLLEDGTVFVIDYKTGQSAKAPASLKKLENMSFSRDSVKNAVHSFQLPVYYYFVKQRYSEKINAALYNLQEADFTDFVKNNKDDADKVMEACLKGLNFIISEIIDPKADFQNDKSNEQNCRYCEFAGTC